MALISTIIQNVPSGTQQIIFDDPNEFENISYSSSGMTYNSEPGIVLSQTDFNLFFTNNVQFYNVLLLNFPAINAFFNVKLPICKFEILSLSTSNPFVIQYIQTSTSSPITNVYSLTFSTTAKTVTFTARNNPITISLPEYLIGFQFLRAFASQVQLF